MSDTWGILSKFIRSPSGTIELSSPYFNMEFDVITSEQHKWSADVTSNPVEDGNTVTDHIKINPDSLDITGVISNASLSRWKGHFIEKFLDILDRESNIQRAFDQLRKLLEKRQPVMIYTRYRNYPDMVLTSLSIPRDKDSGDAIEFTASFTHIKRVKTLTVDSSEAGINPEQTSSKATKNQSMPTQNTGRNHPTGLEVSEREKTENTISVTNIETQTDTNVVISR